MKKIGLVLICCLVGYACQKQNSPTQAPDFLNFLGASVNSINNNTISYYNVNSSPVLRFKFSSSLDKTTVNGNVALQEASGTSVPVMYSYENNDSTLVLQPVSALKALTAYKIRISTGLQSDRKTHLSASTQLNIVTAIDSTDKFPRISDSALLDLVESQTLNYFYGLGHPTSGMALERKTSGDIVTTGGTGFGIMGMVAGAQRGFITRSQALGRIDTVVNFLINKASRYHGAFPHWMNGTTGATIPFSTEDDGADLVETAYMIQGLLTARQFFNSPTDPVETALRDSINSIWNGVDWNWFRQNGQNTLYWHWSPDFAWSSNQQINGWNEALITYVLAASANTDSIPKAVYNNGWAQNGGIRNGNNYFGIPLPLGPAYGGPLFFTHYSFLGINPNGLSDAYANYWTQDTAHAKINYTYCVTNPQHYNGYSDLCWGLTASDDNISGYSAHSPTNDLGIISPTAAISSLPYTPVQSMNALRFFYYTLGDKIWGQYGFVDAFNLSDLWFDSDFLAIDQGPEIVMIENYRSGLLWNLFMSCPEIKRGMTNLGFSSPNL